MNPWEHNPALTRERLITIGQLIIDGRNDAIERFDPDKGCDGWTVGCEAFAFQKHQIILASERFEWLDILNPLMEFVFSIGGVPMRFYRGEPDEPHDRTLRQTFAELQQGSLFSDEDLLGMARHLLYRFAVETDLDGSVMAITFVVLDGSAPILIWPVPLGEPFIRLAPVPGDESEGVILPFPPVGGRKDEAEKEETVE